MKRPWKTDIGRAGAGHAVVVSLRTGRRRESSIVAVTAGNDRLNSVRGVERFEPPC